MMMKELLIECLKRAGKIQLSRFHNIDKISRKESISSIVTEVDLECDKEITGIIQEGFPDHNLLSEETGLRINDSEFTWIIDPLDGTSNYAAGLPWFGVLIAVMKGNIPYMAGAYIPFADKLYLWPFLFKTAYIRHKFILRYHYPANQQHSKRWDKES